MQQESGRAWYNVSSAQTGLPRDVRVLDIAWSPPEHGFLIGAVCSDGWLRVFREEEGAWDLVAALLLQTPTGPSGHVRGCLAFAPQHAGLCLACSVGDSGVVGVYRARDPVRVEAWELCQDFAATPGSTAASGSCASSSASASAGVTCLSWCPSQGDALMLAVACPSGVHLWGLAQGTAGGGEGAGSSGVGGALEGDGAVWVAMMELCGSGAVVAWAPNPGRLDHCLATSGSEAGRLVFWRVAEGGTPSARAMASAAGESTPGLRARPLSQGLAGAGLAGTVQCVVEAKKSAEVVCKLQFNAAGTALASLSNEGIMIARVWRQALSGQWLEEGEDDD